MESSDRTFKSEVKKTRTLTEEVNEILTTISALNQVRVKCSVTWGTCELFIFSSLKEMSPVLIYMPATTIVFLTHLNIQYVRYTHSLLSAVNCSMWYEMKGPSLTDRVVKMKSLILG